MPSSHYGMSFALVSPQHMVKYSVEAWPYLIELISPKQKALNNSKQIPGVNKRDKQQGGD